MRKGNYAVLSGIFLVALAFRLVTLKSGHLLGNDPWAHYKIAEHVLNEGSFLPHSLLSYSIYPHEAYVKVPAGLDYLPLYFYRLVGSTGISFYKTFQIMPSIFGSLAVLPMYLLVRELYSEKTALLSALLLAITPASIERGLAGFYRGDVFMVFTMLFAFYFFIYSVKKNLYASPIAGIFLFLCAFVWDGWPFAFATLLMAFVFGMIVEYAHGKNSQSHRLVISYIITCATGLFLIYVFKQRYYTFSFNDMVWEGFKSEIELVFILFIMAFSFAALHFMAGKGQTRARAFTYTPVLIFLLIVAVLYGSGYISKVMEFVGNFGVWSSSFIPQTIESQNIVELQKPSLGYIYSRFVSLILLAPIGFILHRKTFNSAFSLAFALSSLYVLNVATRFSFLSSPAVCLLGAVSILYILSLDWRKIMAACITLLLLANASASIDFTANYDPFVYDELSEALVWLNGETPRGSIVLTWWSYSGPVQAIADRLTLFGTYPSIGLMEEVSRMFITSDEKKALDIAKTLKADYILMDKRIYDLSPNYMLYTDEPLEPFNSTLFNLYRGEKMENFELVFKNDRVKIYKLLYNYTRIQDVETKRRFFENNEEVAINIEIRSNEDVLATLRMQIYDPDEAELFSREYNVSGSSNINTVFLIPSNPARGTYLIAASLYDSQGNRVPPVVYRTFAVIGYRYGEADVIINARTKYDPLLNALKISGRVTKKGVPLTNEELFIWQKEELWEVSTDENGEFELTVKDINWNKPFYIYTRDKSGYVIVFANINAELVSDLTLSKYNVKRGENVEVTYAVKNNADFPFEGYLTVDDFKLDNKSVRTRLFTEYPEIPYKIEPGEIVNFKHTFTIRKDAPTGRYRIWRAMLDENLKIWVAPTNKERRGFEVEIIIS